jgi:hypothetical protein
MTKYAAYDGGTTLVTGFYDDTVHSSVPSPNIVIDAGEYANALAQQEAGKVLKVVGGVMNYSDPVVVLADYKAAKKRQVDSQAMREFKKHHDFDNAGSLAYQLKYTEWQEAKNDGTPTAGEYPLLDAEATARGVSLATMITDFGTEHAALAALLKAIEIVRLNSREAIDGAADVAAVDTAMGAIAWPV